MLERFELETISKLMKTLNYYQILKVSPLASADEIQESFHREALCFHPDQYSTSKDEEAIAHAKSIYSKVVEAYQVLSNRTKRFSYDSKLKGIDSIDEADGEDENAITSVQRKPEWANTNPGDKFYKLAEKAFNSGDIRSANMNIQIAVGTEPSNPKYMKLKDRIQQQMPEQKKKK